MHAFRNGKDKYFAQSCYLSRNVLARVIRTMVRCKNK